MFHIINYRLRKTLWWVSWSQRCRSSVASAEPWAQQVLHYEAVTLDNPWCHQQLANQEMDKALRIWFIKVKIYPKNYKVTTKSTRKSRKSQRNWKQMRIFSQRNQRIRTLWSLKRKTWKLCVNLKINKENTLTLTNSDWQHWVAYPARSLTL